MLKMQVAPKKSLKTKGRFQDERTKGGTLSDPKLLVRLCQ